MAENETSIEFGNGMKRLDVEMYSNCIELSMDNLDNEGFASISLSRQEFSDVSNWMKQMVEEYDALVGGRE